MKIGDAGEAFFVFETDEDIPENIATSPILEATKPGQTNAAIQRGGRFGAKEDGEQVISTDQDLPDSSQEPDFLDLNASDEPKDTSPQQPTAAHTTAAPDAEQAEEASVAEQSKHGLLERTAAAGKAAIGMAREVGEAGVDKLGDRQVKEAIKEVEREKQSYVKDSLASAKNLYSSASTLSNGFSGEKGDEVLPEVPEKDTAPDVAYGHGESARAAIGSLSSCVQFSQTWCSTWRATILPSRTTRGGQIRLSPAVDVAVHL